MKRRAFLQQGAAMLALPAVASLRAEGQLPALDAESGEYLREFFQQEMQTRHIPGCSAVLLHRDRHSLWAQDFGVANIAAEEPMSFRHIQNVGSISKTFVTVAALQQVEAGTLDLDRDVSEYLDFEVRHPAAVDKRISARMLMRHVSGLRDGSVYARHYACGDPAMSLGAWVKACLSPDGEYYDAKENFTPFGPGEEYEYCNTSYGLLAHLVERTANSPFPRYCEGRIFMPLGMTNASWMIGDSGSFRQTVPYTWVEDNRARGASWGGVPLGAVTPDGLTMDKALPNGFVVNCAYNHPNYPDGFLRMSLADMATWALLWLRDGRLADTRVLETATAREMFSDTNPLPDATPQQGLTWYSEGEIGGETIWGHDGGDPGINTSLLLARESGLAAIVFMNSDGVSPHDFSHKLLEIGLESLHAG